jgi:hypothetical protein
MLETQFRQLDSRKRANNHEHASDDERPEPHSAKGLIPVRLRGRADGSKADKQRDIAARTMVFPDGLGLGLAAIETGCEVLRRANECLQTDQHIENDAEVVVHGDEVGPAVRDFVGFNHNQPGEQCQHRYAVQRPVQFRAMLLLSSRLGRLQDQNRLRD